MSALSSARCVYSVRDGQDLSRKAQSTGREQSGEPRCALLSSGGFARAISPGALLCLACESAGLLPIDAIDEYFHDDNKGEAAENVKNRMLLDDDGCDAYERRDHYIVEQMQLFVFADLDKGGSTNADRNRDRGVAMKAWHNVDGAIEEIGSPQALRAEIIADYVGRTEIDGRGEKHEQQTDDQPTAVYDYHIALKIMLCLIVVSIVPQYLRNAYRNITEPINIRQRKPFVKGDVIIQWAVNMIDRLQSVIKAKIHNQAE